MRIAMLGHKRIPSREGGIEVAVGELVRRMVAKGHSVTCYNRRMGQKREKAHGTRYEGVRLDSVWTVNRRGLAAASSSLAATLKATFGRYDIVHIHGEGPALMCWLPRLAGSKVVVTVHGLDWARDKWGRLASLYIHLGERSAARFADAVIVLSQRNKEYFQKEYGRQCTHIPNGTGIEPTRAADAITQQWGLEKDSYVLFVGRIVPEKNLHGLVEAWKGVRTDKRLVIAGESSDSDDYCGKVRRLAGANVVFTGFVEGPVLAELFSSAYVYCLPSKLEGMPISLLEAMGYGNCCLVSSIPECTEVTEKSAAVFRSDDVGDLQRALQDLINHPDKVARFRAATLQRAKQLEGWDEVTDKTLQLYQSLLQRGHAGKAPRA